MWYAWTTALIVYAAITWWSLLEASAPAISCHQPPFSSLDCLRPATRVGDRLTIQLQLLLRPSPDTKNERKGDIPRWFSIDTCRIDLVIPATGKLPKLITGISDGKVVGVQEKGDTNATKSDTSQHCEVLLPAIARHRSKIKSEVQPLKARFVVHATTPINKEDINQKMKTSVIGTVPPFFLTRVQKHEPRSMMRLLLNSNSIAAKTAASNQNLTSGDLNASTIESDGDKNTNRYQDADSRIWIPYLKFGRSPIRIRSVAEDRDYATLERADGMRLQALNSTFYAPMIYVDELSLQNSAQIELAPFEDNKPAIELQIKFGSISPMVDTLYRQVQASFEMFGDTIFVGAELDELKYFLQDENLYRFALTNIISTIHVWFDYLAFRHEVKFYRGMQNLSGVSSSTVISRMICSLIILLYLIDGGGTSWVVLFSLFSSFVVEVWKVYKLLRPKVTSKFPFVALRQLTSKEDLKTIEYDRIACRTLSFLLYPVLLCWSIYALKTYEYRSLYSWFISNMANGVYTFGFISLCPQLYVNFRLKSVAHLPWKVFLYKIFNTFVDDAFAWLVEMPMKHRLMTLRDDVVFVIFLVQVYLYRVDKTRSNEFGYSYEDQGGEGKVPRGAIKELDDSNGVCICTTNGDYTATPTNKQSEKLKAE